MTPTLPPEASRPCLLVVDDEPDICDSVYDLLRHEFLVLKAHDAAQGARLMQEHEVHVIMTDQRMPRTTGVQLLSSMRVQHPQAVRMLFTGYSDLESLIDAINDARIFRFLQKPWTHGELEEAVREAASEYRLLVEKEIELERLRARVLQLEARLTDLERKVRVEHAPR